MERSELQRGLSAEMLAFRQQVEAFIQSNWKSQGDSRAAAETWRTALLEAGWSVPHWPVEAGGTGWDATQLFIWRQACAAAGIPIDQDVGVELVGPILLRYAAAEQQALYLPGIRTLGETWAVAFAEPDVGIDYTAMQTVARPCSEGWQIQGRKCWVAYGHQAQWLCCFAYLNETAEPPQHRSVGLFAVPADAQGVTIAAEKTFDGAEQMAAVNLDGVILPSSALLARGMGGAEFAHLFVTTEMSTLSQSAVASAQLQVLDEQLQSLDPADELHTERDALAVELQALQAMELRYVDARQRKLQTPFPIELLRIRSREILLKLGALQVQSFGYYALPYPDEMLLHNEGPIGPDTAAATIRQNLTQQVAALYEGSTEVLRDEVWRQLGRHSEVDNKG